MTGKPRSKSTLYAAACFLILCFAATAQAADNLSIECVGTTVCTSQMGSIIVNNNPTFDLSNMGGALSGTAFIAVLVPNSTAAFHVSVDGTTIGLALSGTFTSGNLGDSDNANEPGLNYNFNALASASAQGGTRPTEFTIYEYELGSYSSNGHAAGLSNITAGPLQPGSIIVAWVEDNNETVVSQVPLGKSPVVSLTPEPQSMALFGSGLMIFGFAMRRRRRV